MTDIKTAIAAMHQAHTDSHLTKSHVIEGVAALHIEPRYTRQRQVRKPTSFFQWLFDDKYEWVTVPDLPDLYLNGFLVGRLHSFGPEQAKAVQSMIGRRNEVVSLKLTCHRTESGFYIDGVELS